MFWWDSDDPHPIRSGAEAKKYFEHVHRLYRKLDAVVGDLIDRYGRVATLIVMSDHGFANFGRQFNVNSWLRMGLPRTAGVHFDHDGRRLVADHRLRPGGQRALPRHEASPGDGIVEPGDQRKALLAELIERLEAVTDTGGQPVIRGVYRSDKIYQGNATALAADAIIGYHRG